MRISDWSSDVCSSDLRHQIYLYRAWRLALYSNPRLPIRSRRKRRPPAIQAIDGCQRYKDGDCLAAPWRPPPQQTEARMQKSRRPNFLILMVDQLAGTLWPDGPAGFLPPPPPTRPAERSLRFRPRSTPNPLSPPP